MKEWLAQVIGQQAQIDPAVALVVVAVVSAVTSFVFSFLGRLTWLGFQKWWERRRYGRWKVVVSGGKSGRHWHAPLDKEIVRHLLKGNYVTFKRDLGTIISGEGNLNFSFGVSIGEPVTDQPPEAPGLLIDRPARTITIDFAKACPATEAAHT